MVEFTYLRQSIVVVFEAIQNTRSARFIKSKTFTLRAPVFNLIKRSYSCFKYNTFCCSLPENILSLTPTSNSLTHKYIHFIQSTFTSVDTQPFAQRTFNSTNRRPLIPFFYTLGIIKFRLAKIFLLRN